MQTIKWDPALISKYNINGPRYTSYPTALSLSTDFDHGLIQSAISQSPDELSLYLHIPFCHKLCYYCGCNKVITRHQHKADTYLDALAEHGLPLKEELIINMKAMTYDDGVEASRKLFDLKMPPDGLFAPGDILAVSAVQTAKKRGIKVPQDFAVIGFNNDPISEIIEPNISTITHPAEKMGKAAANIVIDNIGSSKDEEVKEITFLNTEVLVRESSKKI